MKLERHSAILRVLREQRIANQDELRLALAERGLVVAQATLSRDIHELGLTKQADPGGGSFYVIPPDRPLRPDLAGIIRTWVVSIEGVGPLIVLRTALGGGSAVSAAIGQAAWPELIGSMGIAETVLLVLSSESTRKAVEKRINSIRLK